MDEYTFIAEDTDATKQAGEPAVQHVSSEQLYNNELAQEIQVHLPKHAAFCISIWLFRSWFTSNKLSCCILSSDQIDAFANG